MNAIVALALKAALASGTNPASGKQTGNTTTQGTDDTDGADGGGTPASFQKLLAEAFHLSPQPLTTGAKDSTATPTGANGKPLVTNQAGAELANGMTDGKGKNTTDSADLNALPTNSTVVKSLTDDKTDSNTGSNADQNARDNAHDALLAKSATKPVTHTPTIVQPTVVPITVPTPQSSSGEGAANTANGQNAAGRLSSATGNGVDTDGPAGLGASTNGKANGKNPTHTQQPGFTVAVNENPEPEQASPTLSSLRDLAARSTASQITVSATPPQILQAINKSTVNANPEKHVSTVTAPATPVVESNAQAATQLTDVHAPPATATNTTVGSTTPVSTQIADAVVSKAGFIQQGGTTDIYLHLNPPELGTVNLHLRASGDTLTARVVVSSEATRSMIEQQLPDLRARLGESGITLGGFDVAQQHQNAQQQTAQQQEIPQLEYGSSTLPQVAASQGGSSQTQRSGQLDVLV